MLKDCNFVITNAGWDAQAKKWAIWVMGPNDEPWFIPSDETTCKALLTAGVEEIDNSQLVNDHLAFA